MNERIRNALIIAVIGLGLIAVAIFFLTRLVTQSLAPQAAPPAATPITAQVLVATRDMPIGTVLREGDIVVKDVPVEVAPRNAVAAPQDALGKVIKFDMISGQIVLANLLADPTNINRDLAFVLPDDRVLMAFQPGDLMTSLGIPQRGDIVDILMTITKEAPIKEEEGEELAREDRETATDTFTLPAFQVMEIGAVVFDVITSQQVEEGQPTPVPRSQDIRIISYLLALSPQDALLLKHLQDSGVSFDLVLRSPTSKQLFDLVPVTEDYVVDRYQLEVNVP